MSLRHQAGLREKRKLGARLYDTGGAFLENNVRLFRWIQVEFSAIVRDQGQMGGSERCPTNGSTNFRR
jgi:hypothetical protein